MPSKFLMTTAWSLDHSMMAVVDAVLSAKINGEVRDLEKVAAESGVELKNKEKNRPYKVVDGVAVISMNGVMGKRMGMFDSMSGGVSTQRIQMQIEDALTDPLIDALVLSVDSPGGTVDGTAELGDWLLKNRGVKPIFAYADGNMASAAYWIGSACDEIYAYRSATIGSISVVVCHFDNSKKDKKTGIKRKFITSGEYKRIANDAEPLSEKGEAYLQHKVDLYHAMFIEAIATGRGLDPKQVQTKFGDGRTHLADAALEIGMIDHIGSLAETIEAARKAATEESPMNKAELAEKFPELHASLLAEGKASAEEANKEQATKDGEALVAAERARTVGLYNKLHGADAAQGFEKIVASGMDAEQMDALEAVGFSAAAGKAPAADPEKGLKDEILENLRAGDDLTPGGSDSGDTGFMALVESMVADKGVTRSAAMQKIAAQNPKLHEDYLKQANTK